MRMGIHGEWQTREFMGNGKHDSLTIRECHSPNGKGNDHRCLKSESKELELNWNPSRRVLECL